MNNQPNNLKDLIKNWSRPKIFDVWPLLLMNILLITAYFINKWPPVNLFLFFMFETFFIGIWNIIKMYIVYKKNGLGSQQKEGWGPFGLMLFVFVHSSIFGVIQFILFMSITGIGGGAWEHVFAGNKVDSSNIPEILKYFWQTKSIRYSAMMILAFVSLHEIRRIVFYSNELADNMLTQGFRPYNRILIQQFVVILGGFLIIVPFFREYGIFFLLIAFKLWTDIYHTQIDGTFKNNGK